MKTKLQLENINLRGLSLEGITVEAEYSIKEMKDVIDLIKYGSEQLPEILKNLAEAYMTKENLERQIEEFEMFDGFAECEPLPLMFTDDEEVDEDASEEEVKAFYAKKEQEEKEVEAEEANFEEADFEEMLETVLTAKRDLLDGHFPEYVKDGIIERYEEYYRSGVMNLKEDYEEVISW